MANLIITNATNSSFCMNCGQPSEHYAKQVSSDSSTPTPTKRLCVNCINKWDREIEAAKQQEGKIARNTTAKEDDKPSAEEKVQVRVEGEKDKGKEQLKSNEVKKGIVNAGSSKGVGNITQSPVQTGGNISKPNS